MDRSCHAVLAAALALAAAALPAAAQDVRLTGFINGSILVQDASFVPADGHRALLVVEERDDWFNFPDAGSRIGLEATSPPLFGDWRAEGTIEVDFNGAFADAPPFGDEQPQLRLRLAYADLTDGRTTVRVGQQWSLTLGNIPVSHTHTGFIAGWGGGGVLGWRFPGVSVTRVLTPPGARTTADLQVAVLRGPWNDKPEGGRPGAADFGVPQLEARLNLGGEAGDGAWGVYLSGHFDRKDFERAGTTPPPGVDAALSSWAVQGGARLEVSPLTVHGNVHVSRAMAHHFGQLIQFGDIAGRGGWAQLGLDLTPRWSVWGMAGFESADADDVRAAGQERERSLLLMPMLRYRVHPLAVSLELFHNRVDLVDRDDTLTGNQVALSVQLSL